MSDDKIKKVMARGRTLAVGAAGTGTPQVTVGFEVLAEEGGSITWHGFLTPAAEERTIESLQAMGWEGNDITECEGLMEAGKLAKVVELVLVQETYKEKVRWKVKYVNAVGGRTKRLDSNSLAEVQARIKARIGEVSRSNGTPPPQVQQDIPPPKDDDIPF